jgi:hypothetical protein
VVERWKMMERTKVKRRMVVAWTTMSVTGAEGDVETDDDKSMQRIKRLLLEKIDVNEYLH